MNKSQLENSQENIWRVVKFDDLAVHVTDRVEPLQTSLPIYVGLEHLDPESLKIRRWGKPSDVIGTKLKVKAGDVIFGKRRAYQKKVAVADFDCICSAHAMILRAKQDVMNKELFPFFLQSSQFLERALKISVGSLSPTINWRTLAKQEFTIPTKEKQMPIIKVMLAVEDCLAKCENLMINSETLAKVVEREVLTRGIGHKAFKKTGIGRIPKDWKIVPLGTIAGFKNGINYTRKNFGNGVKVINVKDFQDNVVAKAEGLDEINPKGVVRENSFLKDGDILVVRSNGNRELIGRSMYVSNLKESITHSAFTIRVRLLSDKALPRFYACLFRSSLIRRTLSSFGGGTNISNLNQQILEQLPVPLPPIEEQKKIAKILTTLQTVSASIAKSVTTTKDLKMRLIDKILTKETSG